MEKTFTKLQGQYLAFMTTYTEAAPPPPGRSGPAALFRRDAAVRAQYGRHLGATRVDCAHAWSATDYRCACAAGSAASS